MKWMNNIAKLQLRLLFLCFYGRKLEVWNEMKIGRLLTPLRCAYRPLKYSVIYS